MLRKSIGKQSGEFAEYVATSNLTDLFVAVNHSIECDGYNF